MKSRMETVQKLYRKEKVSKIGKESYGTSRLIFNEIMTSLR